MKKNLIFLFMVFALCASAQTLKQIWSTGKIFQVPESVLYYHNSDVLFVSNIVGNPSGEDGRGFISKLSTQGKIINLKWITGLNAPKGMAVFNNKLYVTDINRIAVIDIANSKIEKFIDVPEARFLNDMVFDSEGNLYISDTEADIIFKYFRGKVEKWLYNLENLTHPNGMAFENEKVLAGTNVGILSINPVTKSTNIVVKNKGGIDGLIPLGNYRYLVSDWAGKVQIISPDKAARILLDTTGQKVNAADLGYVPATQTILIPTFFDNRVVAWLLLNN